MFLAKQSDGKSDGFEKLGEKEESSSRSLYRDVDLSCIYIFYICYIIYCICIYVYVYII